MSIDYTQSIENLFESINVIVSKKLEDVSFDTTIICSVTDDSDRKNGKYRVTNGTTAFDAYSDSADYRTGDSVRVQVLNGDYSDKKYIVGKAVTSTDNAPLTYVSPIDTIVNITGNLVDDKGSKAGLIANGTETSINLWGADLSEHEIWTNGIYSALTIRADFRTLLDNYDLKNGSYGLRVHLFIKPSKESAYYVDNYFDLDSSEMFGNPYAFSVYTKQAKKVNLTTTGIVQHIVLSAYQKANFINRSGNLIDPAKRENIFIKNIEIGFGSDLEKIDDNTVKIYTNSNPQYKYYQPTEETNQKTLGLLWYNKNDNNEYLGFSDGIYDPEYDEIEYLKASKEDTRLAAYMAREGIPSDAESLDLAANIDEAIPILQAARKLVTGDLINQLRSFKGQLSGTAANFLTDYTKDSNTNELKVAAEGIEENEEALKKMYADVLAYWYAKSEKETPKDVEGVDDYTAKILVQYDKIVADIKNLLSDVRDECKEKLAGYLGVCDNYEARVNRVLNNITKTLNTLPGITDDYKVLAAYQSKVNFKAYQRKDFSDYNNKYCIYWYRANKDTEADGVMATGWERIEALDNFGIPGKGDVVEGKVRNQVKLPAGEDIAEYYMDANLASETFKAVVFYNHDKFVSDELVFTNADDIPDKSLLDKSDALVINHVTDSRDNYNCYAMTNYLLNAADSSIEREVTCHYDGLLAGDEVLANARAYWYIPEDSTMITVNEKKLTTNGFTVDESRPKTGYICYYKLLEAEVTEKDEKKSYNFGDNLHFWYRIKPYYEQSAAVNDIQCEVILANEDDEDYIAGQLTLTFGQQSTSGTKYTMVIAPATTQRGTTASDNYLMNLHLEDAEGNLITMSTEGLPDTESETAYNLEVTSVMSRAVSGSTYAEAESVAPSCSNTANATEAERWTLTATKNNFGIYQATASIGIATKKTDEQGNEEVVKTRYVDLTTWFSVPWTADGGYYLSGPTSIVYNNLGTLDNTMAYQTPYKLFNDSHELVENVVWSIDSCPKNGKSFDEKDMDLRYMPSLNADNTLSPASTYLNNLEYYPVLIAKQGDNILWHQPIIIMQNQYASNMLNDWDGSFQIDEENGTIMSTMIAAGRKNAGNKFEGVVMGCVAQELEIDELNDSADGIGVYGFHDGAASFGILADGTAFMGKAGNGRILINGNKGTIESAAYSQTHKSTVDEDGNKQYNIPAGMQIDLENGKLVMRSASLGAGENAKWVTAGIDEEDGVLAANESRYSATITMDSNVENDSYLDISVPWYDADEQKWEDRKSLIHIGDKVKDGKIEHSYYLQSQNYIPAEYDWSDEAVPKGNGAGTKVDLVKGAVDAFNLLVQSKNIMLNSNGDEDKPYFVVKNDKGRNLIYCGKSGNKKDEFYLQSWDYKEAVDTEPGNGMRIDLEDATITAYDFTLWSKDIYIASGDEKEGGIIAFTGTNGEYSLSITNDPSSVPININGKFKVGWDGSITTPNFTVNAKGDLTATSGQIGGWNIGTNEIYKGNMHLYSSGTNGYLSAGYCQISSDGYLFATGATLTTLTVNKSLTVAADGDSGSLSVAGMSTLTGAVIIGTSTEKTSLTINGTSTITGDVTFGTDIVFTGDNKARRIWGNANKSFDQCIYFDTGRTYMSGTTISLAASTINVGKDPDGNSKDSSVVNFRGTAHVFSDFHYHNTITCYDSDGNKKPGKTGTFKTSNWLGGSLKLTFINGIMVGSSDDGTEIEDIEAATLPNIKSHAGDFLQVNSAEKDIQWTSIGCLKGNADVSGNVWGVRYKNSTYVADWYSMFEMLGASGNSGKYLTNDGSKLSWATITTPTITSLLPSMSGHSGSVLAVNDNETGVKWLSKVASASKADSATSTSKVNCSSTTSYSSYRVVGTSPSSGANTLVYTYGLYLSDIGGNGSSLRFKDNIKPLSASSSAILYQLSPVSFNYTKNYKIDDDVHYGFIAEEVKKFAPELVGMEPEDSSKCRLIHYNSILTLAVAEIQKLRKELDELKSNL